MTATAPGAAPPGLRRQAEALAAALPPLLAEARHLAATVQLGEHGRRRVGPGDQFWQYRPAHAGDEARSIDWRRSARADLPFVRDKEWQAAQSVHLWVDRSRAMDFTGSKGRASKGEAARVLALALGVLLERAGERVGFADATLPPRSGALQLSRLAEALALSGGDEDYGRVAAEALRPFSRAVFLSDFLGDQAALGATLDRAAGQGVRGVLMQVLDPVEEAFPYQGRTIFESMAGALTHETRRARDLRDRYHARLVERKEWLAELAARSGWVWMCHHTDQPRTTALLALYGALEGKH